VKITANGGVASPTDPIAFLGFSRDEIVAVVEEAHNAQTYVAAHLYTDEAISRAVSCGVRSVEHANLIEAPTARLMRDKGAIACPTLVAYEALKDEGASLGFPPESVAKIDDVRIRSPRSLEILSEAGVKMAYGTDLLGGLHRRQSEEFVIRGRVLEPIEVIRATTCHAADLIGMIGKIRDHQERNTTLLVIEQNIDFVAGFATRFGLMERGRVVGDGRFGDTDAATRIATHLSV
jgi:imidazolonepropionase-like amidohydrolase